jgi:hypothetical protein
LPGDSALFHGMNFGANRPRKKADFEQNRERQASGAEARVDLLAYTGDKSPAYRPERVFAQPVTGKPALMLVALYRGISPRRLPPERVLRCCETTRGRRHDGVCPICLALIPGYWMVRVKVVVAVLVAEAESCPVSVKV